MTEQVCRNELDSYQCSRRVFHPGACISESGHWWAQYDSGPVDIPSLKTQRDELAEKLEKVREYCQPFTDSAGADNYGDGQRYVVYNVLAILDGSES